MSSTGDNKASAATWDNDRHEDLAVILADVSAPIGLENKAIITRKMQERGHNITWGGIRQHLQKLRRKQTHGTAGEGTPKSTPKAGSKRKAMSAPQDIDDDDEELESPTKKVKSAKIAKPALPIVKKEKKDEHMAPNPADGYDDELDVAPNPVYDYDGDDDFTLALKPEFDVHEV